METRQIKVKGEHDIWLAVGTGSGLARAQGFSEADRARVETVISELAHNLLLHGGGGQITVSPVREGNRRGIQVQAVDSGPGIRDVAEALRDGYTTGNGLGIGLGVVKRMMDDFAIRSHPGWGTTITATKWVLGNGE